MSRHSYPRNTLYADYARAAVGMFITAIPLVFAEVLTVFFYIFALLWLLFFIYGLRTAMRQLTIFELSADGLMALGPRHRAIAWPGMQKVELKYYSTQRDKKEGWMQLKIAGGNGVIRVDSTVDDFDALARHVVREAMAHGVEFNPSTQANLESLGVIAPQAGAH